MAGARIFRELGDSVTRNRKKWAQQISHSFRLQLLFKSVHFEQLVCGGTFMTRNVMATEFFALESETLWPLSCFALEPEKRYGQRLKLLWGLKDGYRLKLAGARIFRELGDSVTRKLKNGPANFS